MSFRRGRRQGVVLGAAIASSRSRKREAAQNAQAPISAQNDQQVSSQNNEIEQLKQLAELKEQGILTQEEFDAKKKQILGI